MDPKEDTIFITSDTITLDLSHTGAAGQSVWIDDNMASGTFVLDPNSWSLSDTISIGDIRPQNTISVTGEGADVLINGVGVMETLRGIQEQLNLLQPHPEMEQEWDELRAIREQYEAKLAECREKSLAWQALKQNG